MQTNPSIIFEQNKEKTRVLITGTANGIAKIVLQTLEFFNKKVDYILQNGTSEINGNDFLILENHQIAEVGSFKPTIVLAATENSTEDYSSLLKNITGGGVMIYNENDENITKSVESSENYFRKLPYNKPEIVNRSLQTEIGDIPLSVDEGISVHINGARLLCQQLGIMEEEFYEAVMSY